MDLFLICLILLIKSVSGSLDHLDTEVEYQCIQHCPLQNRTDEGHYDYACDYDCNINQCAKGCKLWKKALNSSCQNICSGPNGRLTPKELYCIMGCNDAITKYFSQLKSKLLIPPAPALVADSLNATSLKLEWNYPEAKKGGLTHLIQWKYEDLTASWHYCRNVTWQQDNTVALIENLQPYTKYRFRVALILGHQENVIVSAPSVVISTLPSGLPASPPSIVRAAPIDCTRISVSWEPGPFPHGPLLSYVLQITDSHPEVHTEVKDIPPENNFYMFRNLKPSRNYSIAIRMRNGIGAGPAAKVLVSTPPEPSVKDTQQPILILGTEHGIIEQGTDIFDEPVILYSTLMTIKGTAIHISKRLLFISDSGGYIIKMPLTKNNIYNTTIILTPQQMNFMPLDLSVDWLNDQLYILGEVKSKQRKTWQITRCNLNGGGLTVAIAGLRNKPSNIEVDAYNGYLFWIVQGVVWGGLYRLDISHVSNGVKHEIQPELILQDFNLGAFTVDHTNFRLLVSNQKENTINSVSLDGKEVTNIRPNVIKSKLQKVVSLATANKKFYWSDGDDVFFEEYHNSDDSYFHNSYPDLSARSYRKVIINLQSSQPIPIPVNPPTNVQAIFGSNIAKISWQPPHLLGIQGKGAWQNWSYEISIKEINNEKITTYNNINTTFFTVKGLAESTDYLVKVAAYTSFGKGPWSTEFRGMTLNSSNNPVILWSASKGLLKSDATGDNVATLINKSQMRNFYFLDVTWYKDQIYLVTNNSYVYWYNLRSHKQGRLIDLDSVGSIAVDWLGKKLYWSNLKRQMIIRGNLNGTQQEPLPIFTLAKELNIDSVKAYLYWSTGYAVECAHLNGADRMEYHPVQLFSGRQVMGLTLDVNEKFVYWIVRGSEGSNLFRAPMAGYATTTTTNKIIVEKISSLQKPNMQGPLCYFHKRLLWLQDDRNAAISDLRGENIATISGKSMSGLTLVYVVDMSLHIEPEISSNEIVVIPETIDRNTIKVIGSSNAFNITWKPIENVNYGNVFYEISIESSSKNGSSIITTTPSIKYWQKVKPFTELQVAVRAFTYWGTSPQIIATIFSPSSTPSVPRNLRYYLTYQHDSNDDNDYVIITLRWDPPMCPNGVIEGYKIHCWYFTDNNNTRMDLCDDITKSDQLEYVVSDDRDNRIYNFEVQAFTEIGDGDLSETISIDSTQESPLPTLLIATNDSILIQDIDRRQNKSLLFGINTPKELCFLVKENKLFWINQLQDLMMFDLVTLNKTKIIDLNYNTTSLTIDWLERSLYFVQTNQRSTILKIDLNQFDKSIVRVEEILTTDHRIEKLEVSPFTKKLYWIEDSQLEFCNTDGSEVQHFFHNQAIDDCNCDYDTKIGKTFTLDHSNGKEPLVIFLDNQQNILSTDKNGCYCKIVVTNTIINKTLSIERIISDSHMVYWTNSEGYLYSFKQNTTSLMINDVIVNDVFIYGNHIQPYPVKECLKPKQQNASIALIRRTATSLTLKMPEYSVKSHCLNTSMATVEYNVYYKQFDDYSLFLGYSCENAKLIHTFDKDFTIESLKAFTKYAVAVTIRNYYTAIEDSDNDSYCHWMIFQTAVGVPSKPQNVSAKVLTPTLAKVTWLPPKELNGATVHYEIYWQTSSTLSGVRQKEQPIVEQQYTPNSTEYFTTILNKLSPNETYTIWVRAYSETNETSNDSDKIQIITYPEPSDLVLFNSSAYILKLAWNISDEVSEYHIQYSPLIANDWFDTEVTEEDDAEIIVKTDTLVPKTQYKFRLLLVYREYDEEYIWPLDSRYTFETLGDKPTPPGVPFIQYIRPDIYKVSWEPSRDNGAPIEMYLLEGLQLPIYRIKRSANRSAFYYTAPSIEETEWEWLPFYNGTETSWIIDGLSDKFKYAFRVLALNSYGWSEPSEESTEFDLNESARMAERQSPLYLIILAICLPISIVLFIIVCTLCLKCGKPKKEQIVTIPRGPDVELATLRELPRRGVHNTNVLYVSTQPTSEEITLLPHIRRDQITLTKFLGSGAFGEVFEGKARAISSSSYETKVAVKTLRKGASDQEKQEFLQEAQLMSNFKHEHILQLLGVCLDNDPHFIIMELMQGGDLLTYLRSSRNPSVDIPTLTLMELLKMCVDVARGCRYLEEMHFVHRDLACRNCLVSSNDTESRIVKIGDFGLARDIYKNDYYRKEGEGLLPVRWMAPESLVDGVFTSQSDVWAFGVLLWEIMTLGQQPYPARNNLEVLHYVRRGGRLGKPMDCPSDLHNLMLQCWSFEPDKRPTFKYCLDVLENLHFQNLRNPTTAAHEGQYISTVQDCDTDDEINKEKTPFLTNPEQDANVPKYLELLCDPQALPNDGYEIPNQMLQDDLNSSTSTDNASNNNNIQYKDDTNHSKLNMNGFVK